MKVDFSDRLIEIAQLQFSLLKFRYDFKKRMPVKLQEKKTGLFSSQPVLPSLYVDKAALLKKKQELLMQDRMKHGFSDGIFWWNLPWERVIPLLLQNLTFPEEECVPDENGWRKGFSFREQEGRDHNKMLCLDMQEHFQQLVSSRNVKDVEHSVYTKAEREAMVDAYNSKKNQRAMAHVAFANDIGIHSIDTGWDYHTAFDYYTSGEYISDRLRESEQYSQSLYSIEERNTLYVNSHSTNRRSIYGICEFHVDLFGKLDYLASMDFEEFYLSAKSGDFATEFFSTKDAAVIGAFLLSENENVKSVPMSMFEFDNDYEHYADVVRLAEILTCLANKLKRS